jgi:immune inhibitor A
MQVFDATFGLEATDPVTLHINSQASAFGSQRAIRAFDDQRTYWFAERPDAGVKVPTTGTRITVVSYDAQTNLMQVRVRGPQ